MGRTRRGRGEGGIRKHPSGHWEATVSMGTGADGKRRRKTVTGKTKGEVHEKLRVLQGQGPVGDAGNVCLAAYLERHLATAKGRLEATTYETYESILRLHLAPACGNLKLAKVSAVAVESVYQAMTGAGASAHTVQAAHRILSGALKRAVRLKLIPSNPCADAARPRPKKAITAFLTAEQASLFLNAASGRPDYALYCVALSAGLRQGELFALAWRDYDPATGVVSVRRTVAMLNSGPVFKEPKSAAGRRSVGLPPSARAALDARRPAPAMPDDLIFGDRNGNPMRKSNFVRRSFHPLLKQCRAACVGAGVAEPPEGFTFHGLRHTHASLMVSRGMSLKAVSQRLGHSSVEITLSVYSHVMPNDDARVAAEAEVVFGKAPDGIGGK